jgi:hypothetical protein
VVFVVVTLVANLPLLAIDIHIFRSRDFYAKYEAGSNKELLAIAEFIRQHPPAELIAVHEKYDNMGRIRWSKYGIRALHLLCDKPVIPVERKKSFALKKPEEEELRKSLRGNHVTYCVTQESWTPWRIWHFRLSPSFQQWLTKRAVTRESGGWELWGRSGAKYKLVNVPQQYDPPTRVPGL